VLKGRGLRAVLDRPADVTHFHNVSLVGGPGVLAYGSGVKLYTAHEHWLVCPTHVLWKLDRAACDQPECLRCTLASGRPPQLWRYTSLLQHQLRQLDALIVASRFSAGRHAQLGVRTELLPHFVPEPTPPPSGPLPHPRPYVLYSGRLEKVKGILWLMALFRDYRGVDLLVAGDGSEEARVRAEAANLSHVRVMGRLARPELDALARGALAVVVPSLSYETFGLTAIEALAVGCPVIVRDLGPLPEIVEQSGAGFTFRTPGELLDAIERLRTGPSLRAQLGRRGTEAYRRYWTEERHLRRYLQLIEEFGRARRIPKVAYRDSIPAGAPH
jgi:glycosyltransferase involved in cell wall biosynthesis